MEFKAALPYTDGPPLHRRPSPTQTAPRGGRSRDYLVGGGRSASHVPYPDLAGRHRGQAAIGATGVTGAALNSLFYRSRVQPLAVTAETSWLHRPSPAGHGGAAPLGRSLRPGALAHLGAATTAATERGRLSA